MFGISFFVILNVSGLVRIISITQNITKQDPFGSSVRVHFYRIEFDTDFRAR